MLSLRPLLATGLLLMASCRNADVASANLDQLLGADHSFRYSGNLQTGASLILENVLDTSLFKEGSLLNSSELEPIPNPTAETLENLLTLRESSLSLTGPFLDAERIRHYTRYAAYCPSVLGRERAYLELARHCSRLQVPEVLSVAPGSAANAPELAEGIRGLTEVLAQLAGGRSTEDATTRRDFEAACSVLGGLEYDIEGGRRLLRVIAAFGGLPGVKAHDLTPLLELSNEVQTRVVGLTLTRGRYDPSGRVRAAAIQANYAAHGAPFLSEALLALVTPRQYHSDGSLLVSARFNLVPELGNETEPYTATLALIRAGGLPAAEGSEATAIAARLGHLRTLMQLTHDFASYPDRVRALAMSTLGEVSGSGLRSLREEDWSSWWSDFLPGETDRLQRAKAAEGGQAPPLGGA